MIAKPARNLSLGDRSTATDPIAEAPRAAASLMTLYKLSGDPRFRRAAGALQYRSPKKKGRREIDDRASVEKVRALMRDGGQTRWAAAITVAADLPGHSKQAVARRLYRKARRESGQ